MERNGERFLLGVQWHPEMASPIAIGAAGDSIFAGLIAAAKEYHS